MATAIATLTDETASARKFARPPDPATASAMARATNCRDHLVEVASAPAKRIGRRAVDGLDAPFHGMRPRLTDLSGMAVDPRVSARIRESLRRVPGSMFKGDIAVRMSNGATYYFPRFTRSVEEPHHALLKAHDAARTAGDVAAMVAVEIRLFAYILSCNYLLKPGEVGELVRLDYSPTPDPVRAGLRRALLAVAYGQAPDAS